MTFDSNISESVSLSKILDAFIETDEKPSIIISFLEDHLDNIRDIFQYSDYAERLFFIDFIAKCSFKEIEFIKSIMPNKLSRYRDYDEYTMEYTSLYLVWQILQSNLPDKVKLLFRPYLNTITPPKHPYAGRSQGDYVLLFDRLFKDAYRSIDEIASDINRITDDKFETICFGLENSLFAGRLFQKDLFILLDVKKQYIILNEIRIRGISRSHLKFLKQLLISPIDIELKYFVYQMFDGKNNERFPLTVELMDILKDNKNLPQLMLKVNLYGTDLFMGEIIFYLLYNHKLDWLKDMLDNDKDMITEYFDVVDLLEKLM